MPLLSHACWNERRIALPSIAISRPPLPPASAAVQAVKHRSNASGARRAKTRLNVSWLGTPPPGKSKKVLNHASLLRANSSTSTQPSAPQITAQAARTIMSCSLWITLRARGSGKS